VISGSERAALLALPETVIDTSVGVAVVVVVGVEVGEGVGVGVEPG
jgi:hypothetical protein